MWRVIHHISWKKTWTHFPEWHYISYLLCHSKPSSKYTNYKGSSVGMEGAGILKSFNRSLCARVICHTKYFGDKENKAYQRVSAEKPDGLSLSVKT
jgi:hypothetical protein